MIAALAALARAGVEPDVAPPALLDEAYASRRVALVVGIDRYDDPALGDLRFAGKDAADLAAVLDDPALGDYDVVSVVAGAVGRAELLEAFDAVAATVRRDDTVLVYVAAHGTLDLGPAGTALYVLPTDGRLDDPRGTGLPVAALAEALAGVHARRTVLVLDACYAGVGRSALPDGVRDRLDQLRGPVPAPPAYAVSEFSAHLYAAHVHQPALEDPTLENGVYTHWFVEALRGAGDRDGDGLVEVMEAHGYARDRTLEFTGGTQVPWAETVSIGRQEVYLSGNPAVRRATEEATLVGLEALPAGASLLLDGLPRGGGPLPPGRRDLEVRADGAVLAAERLTVRPGSAVDLGRMVARRRGRWTGTVGAVGAADGAWLGRVGLAAGLEGSPADAAGGRFAVGLAGRVGPGPAAFAVAGTAAATLGWRAPLGALELGPTLGAGALWRLPAASARGFAPQGTPALVPGVDLRHRDAGLDLALTVPLFRGDGALVAVPSLSLGVTASGGLR